MAELKTYLCDECGDVLTGPDRTCEYPSVIIEGTVFVLVRGVKEKLLGGRKKETMLCIDCLFDALGYVKKEAVQ